MTPRARFDDMVDGSALEFGHSAEVVVAHRPEDVAAALETVDALTADGRWAYGFVAYEAAPGLDPQLVTHEPADGLPLAWFAITDAPQRVPPVGYGGPPRPPEDWACAWDEPTHAAAVERVRELIADGETYQCNLTTHLTATAPGDLDAVYRDLALGQRGAHHALLDTGRFAIVSASPELFMETDGDRITMRPMKGTAARGRTPDEDARIADRLRASRKECAENVMIVDLVRNDLARIAVPGSVTVPRLLSAERYETVHQLTSDVTARLLPDTGLTDLFRALFPCGSVTGAPKRRTMEIVQDVEDGPRGVYCGAIGVVAPPGSGFRARFSVAIRTVVADRERGTAVYGTGGGITWDSRPEAEYAELRAKAAVLHARPQEFHLIETMRHEAGHGVRSLDAHLSRIASSAVYFGFRFDGDAVRSAVKSGVDGAGDARVRLLCHRDGAVEVELGPLPAPADGPVRLAVDPEPIDSRACLPFHKTSLRSPYDDRLARHPDADDVVLVNERGEVTETCRANLAVHLDGRWWTPASDCGLLPGVERARLLASGVLRERVLGPADLAAADGLGLVNALRGWRPATLLDDGSTPSRPTPSRPTHSDPENASSG
ncbi:aminodeoxychorismate synthase component I [Pseudonocardia endophytica]|uniref:Para-aminobenzoate synthetase/4-amino-4-deoxychorismate lyase n=1 Tax=Pseudonocardia endophytica TaxID=401976 RepID=A0A4R1HXU9_PSEEN|nr:aminodeoxychorismate synthase component I [Pseudonocardia endophytica]TCK25670.1 para-aminobenzoate synthetase/4-amino-4-deoxychorismate lyase [Pseudonocardia endophytica]